MYEFVAGEFSAPLPVVADLSTKNPRPWGSPLSLSDSSYCSTPPLAAVLFCLRWVTGILLHPSAPQPRGLIPRPFYTQFIVVMGMRGHFLTLLSEFTFAWGWVLERGWVCCTSANYQYCLGSLSRGHKSLLELWSGSYSWPSLRAHGTWLPFPEGSLFKKKWVGLSLPLKWRWGTGVERICEGVQTSLRWELPRSKPHSGPHLAFKNFLNFCLSLHLFNVVASSCRALPQVKQVVRASGVSLEEVCHQEFSLPVWACCLSSLMHSRQIMILLINQLFLAF